VRKTDRERDRGEKETEIGIELRWEKGTG